MRYVRIFLLQFQRVLEYKSVNLVWFLIPLFNSGVAILFWKGALKGSSITGWNFSSLSSYYLFLIIAGSILMIHVEDDVSRLDIRMGGLIKYLLRPFSYFWLKFLDEIPWRLIQGIYGLLILFLVSLFFKIIIPFSQSPDIILLSIIIAVLAYFLSFTFKMIIGILAFWIIDIMGLYQLIEIAILIFAGFLMPIELFPSQISAIAHILPFSYMIYFPIVAFQGKLGLFELIKVIEVQFIWIIILSLVYKLMWGKGIKRFSGVGQ